VHPFPEGSRLLLYTDGLTEVFQGDEEFGTDRLLDAFRKCPPEDGGFVLESLWRAIDEFSGGAPQRDDMTALTLARFEKGFQA
ncbi:MAG: SpoIIE family protein phosphatase, partial [Acidobacteria bacterium]|nr:SpoIIE family protein phosphatase [Acidobacteriota bacterium]